MSEKDTHEEAMRAFRQFDVERTGKISFENLKVVSREVSRSHRMPSWMAFLKGLLA